MSRQSFGSLTVDDQLREAREELDDACHDLEIAASLGKQLLEENLELKEKVESLAGPADRWASEGAGRTL